MTGQPGSGGPAPQGRAKGLQEHMDQLGKLLAFIKAITMLSLWLLAVPAEVLLRHTFGERYLRLSALIVGVLLTGLIASMVDPDGTDTSMAVIAYGLLAIVFGVFRIGGIKRRDKRGVPWHSRSDGVSYRFWKLLPRGQDAWFVAQAYEPGVMGGLGIAALMAGWSFGWVMLVVALALMLKSAVMYDAYRARLLDAMDARIEAEHMAEALEGRSGPEKTAGLVVPGSARWSTSERETIKRSVDRLDPGLKSLIEQSSSNPEF